MTFDCSQLDARATYKLLANAVAPRPICFASTVSAAGNVNLAPYSFFNVVSGNPPYLVFAPQRSGRTLETKDTYNNVLEVPEVVINVVTHAMGPAMSDTSAYFPPEVNEFEIGGFTPVASERVRPPRVAESPVSFECSVERVIDLGDGAIAGSLVVAKVLLVHVHDKFLTEDGQIDPTDLDLIGRMGGDDYVRASGEALFRMPKPE